MLTPRLKIRATVTETASVVDVMEDLVVSFCDSDYEWGQRPQNRRKLKAVVPVADRQLRVEQELHTLEEEGSLQK